MKLCSRRIAATPAAKATLGLMVVTAFIAGGAFYLQRPANAPVTTLGKPQATAPKPAATHGSVSAADTRPADSYEVLTETTRYKIRKDTESATYIVTLYGTIITPKQHTTHRNEVNNHQQQALDYLSSQGVQISAATIFYEFVESDEA